MNTNMIIIANINAVVEKLEGKININVTKLVAKVLLEIPQNQ
jgi:hypothetical protein